MSFTEQEFNLAMAEMEKMVIRKWECLDHKGQVFGPYSDLNQFIPIAFKHDLLEGRIIEPEFNCFIQSLREDLWKIYLEGNSDE